MNRRYVILSACFRLGVVGGLALGLSACNLSASLLSDQFKLKTRIDSETTPSHINDSNQGHFPIAGHCPQGAKEVVLEAQVTTTFSCVDGEFSGSVDLSVAPEGEHVFVLRPDVGESKTWVVVKDITPPTVTLDPVAPFINLANASSFPVSGTCSESGRIVYIKSDLLRFPVLCSQGSFNGTINLSSLSEGAVALTVTHMDAAGNESVSSTSTQKDTIRPGKAVLTNLPASPSPHISLNSVVGGVDVTEYAFKVGVASGVSCADTSSGYSSFKEVSVNLIADISSLPDTTLKLCVWTQDIAGNRQQASDIYEYTWNKDSTIALATVSAFVPAGNISNVGADRTLTIGGVSIMDYKAVVLYNQSECSGADFSGAIETPSTSDFTFSISSDGTYLVCVIGKNVANYWQPANAATASDLLTVDRVPPSLTLASTSPSTFNTPTIGVTATFSESVTGFESSDIVVTNGTVSDFNGSGTTYTFTVTPSNQGLVTVAVNAGVAKDPASNGNTAATSLTRTYDSVAPTLSLNSLVNDPFKDPSFNVTATFSESVTGFESSDILVTNGILSGFSGSGATYTFTVTPLMQGLVTVAVAAGAATDAAGHGNTAATSLTRTYDSIAPTITGLNDDFTWQTSKTWSWGCNETCTYRFVVDTNAGTIPSGGYGATTTASQSSGSGTYYLHVQAQDQAGNTSITHVSVLLDNANPTAPTSVNDGITLSSLTQSPTITFTGGTDAHSGVQKHQLRVLRVSDSFVMKDWHDFTSSSAVTGLTLATNTSYKVEIKTLDNLNQESSVTASDGWIADTTSPSAPTGLGLGGIPSNLTSSPPLSWSAASDGGGSGISSYQAIIYRATDHVAISSWTTLTSGGSLSGLSLTGGVQYYFKVKALDKAGNMSAESGASANWTAIACTPGSKTFTSTGADQTFTVPTGCSSITVKMWGAGGSGIYAEGFINTRGGGGGYTTGKLSVIPGESLTVIVGQGGWFNDTGSSPARYGGGGATCYAGGQGGGRSAIRRSGTELLTAGGGGGGGMFGDGAAGGGLSGQNATSHYAGGGASQVAGGAGGAGGMAAGYAGSQFFGGNGRNLNGACSSSGGGGYFGGGSSAISEEPWWFEFGAGGGGSGYLGSATSASTFAGSDSAPGNAGDIDRAGAGQGGTNGTDGLVIISW